MEIHDSRAFPRRASTHAVRMFSWQCMMSLALIVTLLSHCIRQQRGLAVTAHRRRYHWKGRRNDL